MSVRSLFALISNLRLPHQFGAEAGESFYPALRGRKHHAKPRQSNDFSTFPSPGSPLQHIAG